MKKTKNILHYLVTSTLLMVVVVGTTSFAYAQTLTRQLQIGMSGADVGWLQSFLARDASIYPQAIISNYFGSLTRAAVARWQTRNGIAAVGRVGPQTLAAINAQMNSIGNNPTTGAAPIISMGSITLTNSTSTLNWNTNVNSNSVVYYSTTPLSVSENDNGTVTVNNGQRVGSSNYLTAHTINLTGLSPNTTYYYMIQAMDQNGNISVTVPTNTFRTGSF